MKFPPKMGKSSTFSQHWSWPHLQILYISYSELIVSMLQGLHTKHCSSPTQVNVYLVIHPVSQLHRFHIIIWGACLFIFPVSLLHRFHIMIYDICIFIFTVSQLHSFTQWYLSNYFTSFTVALVSQNSAGWKFLFSIFSEDDDLIPPLGRCRNVSEGFSKVA